MTPRTGREALDDAQRALEQAGIDGAQADARILLAFALDVPLNRVDTRLRDPLPPTAAGKLTAMTRERASRRPLAYITGETEFVGFTFRCDERALVPRPETEILIETVLPSLAPPAPPPTVIDVGTGTGCIGLSLAKLVPGSRIILSDISTDALALAEENAAVLGVLDRVEFLSGAYLDPVRDAGLCEEIDCLVSNPPYVPAADAECLMPEVAEHEPRGAWLGEGPDGTDAYARLIEQAASELACLRLVAFEVGIGQAQTVGALCSAAWPGWEVSITEDLSGIERIVTAEQPR